MKKQMLKNILVLSLTTLIMGALIGLAYFITAPIIKRNQELKIEGIAKQSFADGKDFWRMGSIPNEYKKSDASELTKDELAKLENYMFAFNEDKEYIGVLIIGKGNGYGGEIEIAVAINRDDLIHNIDAVSFSETPGIGDKALEKYKGEYKDVDLNFEPKNNAGATKTSNGIKQAVEDVVKSYKANKAIIEKVLEFKKDPLKEAFGDNYVKVKNTEFVATEILIESYDIKVDDVKQGFSLVGKKYHEFDTGYSNVEGNVALELIMDNEFNIISYELVEYEHSDYKSYMTAINNYLSKFIGTNAQEITSTIALHKNIYLDADVTETCQNTIDVILLAIEAEVNK